MVVALAEDTDKQETASFSAIGIGEVVAHSPLPHDRTCGSRIRRFGGVN